jgi:transcription elongation factor GreA
MNMDIEEQAIEAIEFKLRPSDALQAPHSVRLTREGLRRLEQELQTLEQESMPAVVERIRAIREMSADPLEGGDYAQAMEEMAQLRAREAVLRTLIGSGEIVEDHGPAGLVQLGSTVTLAENHHKEMFTIVGSAEADALKGRLSEDSPLGRSLLWHHAGDTVQWDSPAGVNRARIVRIARLGR